MEENENENNNLYADFENWIFGVLTEENKQKFNQYINALNNKNKKQKLQLITYTIDFINAANGIESRPKQKTLITFS